MLERAAELAGAEAAPRASPAIYPSCPEVTVAVIAVHITLERGRVTSAPAAKTCEAQKKPCRVRKRHEAAGGAAAGFAWQE